MECFCKFLMLNISSIKELLRKPLKIQRNITRNLPEKLKRKIFGLYFLANFYFLFFFFLGGGRGGDTSWAGGPM